MIGQGVMALNCRREGLVQLLGINSLLRGWWSTGTGCPEVAGAPSLEIFKALLDRPLSNLV